MGYFGFNESAKAYIEVMSFDRLVNSATERNRAFFDKLGLPSSNRASLHSRPRASGVPFMRTLAVDASFRPRSA
jgi:hypothetical protein